MRTLKVIIAICTGIFMVQFTTPERINNETAKVYYCNGKDCDRKVFQTKLCKDACEKGGQKEESKPLLLSLKIDENEQRPSIHTPKFSNNFIERGRLDSMGWSDFLEDDKEEKEEDEND